MTIKSLSIYLLSGTGQYDKNEIDRKPFNDF